MTGRSVWGASVNSNLGYQEAKLPNITGGFHGSRGNGRYAWGAFIQGSMNHGDTGRRNPTTPNNIMNISMDSSRASSAYTDSGVDTLGRPNAIPTSVKLYCYTRFK